MEKVIKNKKYKLNENEYTKIHKKEYNNLRLYNEIGLHERIIGLIKKCKQVFSKSIDDKYYFVSFNTTHGGFIPINLSNNFDNIYLFNTTEQNSKNINENKNGIKNIYEIYNCKEIYKSFNNVIIYSENYHEELYNLTQTCNWILITKVNNLSINCAEIYTLSNTDYYIYVDKKLAEKFVTIFCYYILDETKILNFDNLINLCIMVKNGGPQFEQMLIDNLPIIDKWTILDTGSSDATIEMIKSVLVGKKEGNLYEEPFLNFRDSRNRLLDLAGSDCKYILMLDDTYVVKGHLRDFLTEVRSDQYSKSFTLFIHSDDTKYGSNRIIHSDSGLRYVHKIHEIITDKDNINIVIPEDVVYIEDRKFDYMEKRTKERKQMDLKLLYEEVEDNPNDPRSYYYLGQTYNNLEDYENAFKYFMKRASFTNSGFIQERVDALFEAARTANFKLNRPWEECMALYEECYKVDESRPESLYFIGVHYYLEGDYKKAFPYFKKGFEIGFPIHCQYSLKPTLSFHFLPKFLTKICYELEEFKLGEDAALFFLKNNKPSDDDYYEILSWYNIFVKLNQYTGPKKIKNINLYNKPLFVFVADGGFQPWSGSNILTSGVGGSETYIIEMARYIQQFGKYQTIVFCNTPNNLEENFENTIYKPLTSYYEFINTTYVDTCIISRFSEYLPVTFKGFSENVYLVVHDLTPSGIIIPMDKKLKNVFCLTEWHVDYLTNIFVTLKPITVPFYYGCNISLNYKKNKIPYKFIYSSFPNRGLLELLQMWKYIYIKEPRATLHIYSDVDNEWSNKVEPDKMQQIRQLLEQYKLEPLCLGIHYHGWVKKTILEDAWKTADIWFYPCTFMETFCLTALEAAKSQTFVITNNLAALQNTVGNRGCIIKGDPTTQEWKQQALEQVFFYMDENNLKLKEKFIEMNYEWSTHLSWKEQANKLLDQYILPNSRIEYKGMYNWTNDLPIGDKQLFVNVIEYFNQTYTKVLSGKKINVLEIGTYTGISLINIINMIPNSNGIGVDLWTSYNENNLLENMDLLEIEKSFYKNINTFGLQDRIIGLKQNSTNALISFIQEKKMFDFIYIDGSHLLLDCYSDLLLAWNIIEKDGIIAIDDYLYKKDFILESPFEGVNHFLKRYEGKYNLLHKGYRVFLQKL
jgi:tetratricopeptide (TPR) repeat protein